MALLSVIRRWYFRDHLSIREICRRTGLSRNTIRKYLRPGGVEPKFKVPERPSKLDPFADRLAAWLKTESKKGRKQKRTMKQLHADLVSLGYEGSYNRVAAFAREWRDDRQRELQTTGRGTFVPLAFEPGEAFQFDWSEDWAIIGNERTKLQVAHTKLSYSRAFIVRAYLLQTHEMLAAIGHDLRTPLTTLRLRAEFVEDEESQQKMLATIDEMQSMTEAAIAFARGQSTDEVTRAIQLEALVESVCDDLAELGHPVTYIDTGKFSYRCRADGIRRAVRNLIENAIRYGGEAKVFFREETTTIDLVIEDRGPGIPECMREKVFAPFFRLEASRNRDTGGIGLGLSISRAIVRQHGGEISFISRENGMQAIIALPLDGLLNPEMTASNRLRKERLVRGRSRVVALR